MIRRLGFLCAGLLVLLSTNLLAFTIDTTNRTEVRYAYDTIYVPAFNVPSGWSGNIGACNAGTTSLAHQKATINAANFYRALTGLPPVRLISDIADGASTDPVVVQNTAVVNRARAAALYMAANNTLTHSPVTSGTCYSADALAGASTSNLAGGHPSTYIIGPRAIEMYMNDDGADNESLGHRRWILFSQQVGLATGDVPNPVPTSYSSNALRVFAASGENTTLFRSATALPSSWVAWPSPNFVPRQLIPSSGRWSISYPGANFSNATVTMTASDGTPVTAQSFTTSSGSGDNTLRFEPIGLPAFSTGMADTSYKIVVSGVAGTGVPSSYCYTVTVFDPDSAGSATAPDLCATGSTGDIINLSDTSPPNSGNGWTYQNSVYTIASNANVTVINNNQQPAASLRRLVVAANATDVTITLRGASITDLGSTQSALLLNTGANVKLILADGSTNTLTAWNNAGIQTTGATLTIEGDAAGTGVLNANGSGNGAGIGGTTSGDGGTITINGGTINAKATGSYGAGIGGGQLGAGGTITINDGIVNATGFFGAGIGGGANSGAGQTGSSGGTITITGGTITATNTSCGAGIGGGWGGPGGDITISGGIVTAIGGGANHASWGSGAGIGGGGRYNASAATEGAGGNILIYGENTKVTAKAGHAAAQDIGAGVSPDSTLAAQGNVFVALSQGHLLGRNDLEIGNPVSLTAIPATAAGIVKATLPAPFNAAPFAGGAYELLTGLGTGANSKNLSVTTTFTTQNLGFALNGYNVAPDPVAGDHLLAANAQVDFSKTISITTQPAPTTTVTVGQITQSLTILASVSPSGTPEYQWYSNTTNSNVNGTLINGETGASFAIPTTLAIGTHHYYCVVTVENEIPTPSNVATVTVIPQVLTGAATISNTNPRIGDTLTGSLVGGNNTGTLAYTWKDGANNTLGTGATYAVLVGDLNKTITLEIMSSVETGTLISAATAAVLKKAAPAAPAAPTLVSKTHNSVTLTAIAGYEFSRDSVTWQVSNVFGGLMPSTPYSFYQRIAETADTLPSPASSALPETTDAHVGTNEIDLSETDIPPVGIGWTYANNVYTILDGADVIVTGNNAGSQRRLAVEAGAEAIITLDDASITGLGNNQSALLLNAGADVTLILLDGTANTLTGGESAAGIQTTGATLTIEGDAAGDGVLNANGGSGGGGAGIGGAGGSAGGAGGAGGAVTINGGVVHASGAGAVGGAGIGGGGGSTGGTGGAGGAGGAIMINGGEVTANGGSRGAGIGGGGGFAMGAGGAGGAVTINGGVVHARGGTGIGGAGIGGGGGSSAAGGAAGNILIYGEDTLVTATKGSANAQDIGAGFGNVLGAAGNVFVALPKGSLQNASGDIGYDVLFTATPPSTSVVTATLPAPFDTASPISLMTGLDPTGKTFSVLTTFGAGNTIVFELFNYDDKTATGDELSSGSAEIHFAPAAVTLAGIAVMSQPAQLSYTEGQNLDLSGLVVTLNYSDGSAQNVPFASFGANITTTPAHGVALTVAAHHNTVVTVEHTASGFTATTNALTVNPAFVAVTNITGVPTTATAGTPLALSGTVVPNNATNQTIAWSVQNAGTTGATIVGNTLNTTAAGTVTVAATIENGVAVGTSYTQNFNITVNAAFVAVTDITNVPTTATAGTPLTLSGTVAPNNATNQTIVWSVQNAGTTGATIVGNTLNTTAAGTVTVAATIENGVAVGTSYTQNFSITVNAAPTPLIASAAITVPTPIVGATPATTASACGPGFTCTVSWLPNDNPFRAGVAYTVTVTLTADAGNAFADPLVVSINGVNVTATLSSGNITAMASRTFSPLGAGSTTAPIPVLNPAMLVLLMLMMAGLATRRRQKS